MPAIPSRPNAQPPTPPAPSERQTHGTAPRIEPTDPPSPADPSELAGDSSPGPGPQSATPAPKLGPPKTALFAAGEATRSRLRNLPPEDSTYIVAKVHAESLERLRDAVAAVQASHPHLTLRWAIARGMALVRQELEEHYHQGAEFPIRPTERLKAGSRGKATDGQPLFRPGVR